MTTSDIILTDDEAVAIAVNAAGIWPGALPTVDQESESHLLEAMLRGQRSLSVRGLVTAEGRMEGALERVADAVLGAPRFVSLFIGDDDARRLSWDLSVYHYPRDGAWLTESISPHGVHRFEFSDREGVAEACAAVVVQACATPPPGQDLPAPWLTIAVVGRDGSHVLRARHTEAQVARFNGSGTSAAWERIEPDARSLREWLESAIRDESR